jgi:hypothetical protein
MATGWYEVPSKLTVYKIDYRTYVDDDGKRVVSIASPPLELIIKPSEERYANELGEIRYEFATRGICGYWVYNKQEVHIFYSVFYRAYFRFRVRKKRNQKLIFELLYMLLIQPLWEIINGYT